jgi:Domain of unknown function (DUF5664)
LQQSRTIEEIDAEKRAKPSPSLVPARSMIAAARAFSYGETKHGLGYTGRGTYRDAGTEQASIRTHFDSLERHLAAIKSGEFVDPESGLSHYDCAMAQMCIVVDLVEDPPGGVRPAVDLRFVPEAR